MELAEAVERIDGQNDQGPPEKRQKVQQSITEAIDFYIAKTKFGPSLKPVLDMDYDESLPKKTVYAGHVTDKKNISKVILILNEKLPLGNLSHLKRVRHNSVILCPTDILEDELCLQNFVKTNIPELQDMFGYFQAVEVPAKPPKLKKQMKFLSWPCNFHPNKYLESLLADNFFKLTESEWHIKFMEMAFEVMKFYLKDSGSEPDIILAKNATVIVDFENESVVAAAFCNDEHPIQHSTMLAIDNVAKTQHGGAWGSKNSTDYTLNGFEPDLLSYFKEKFPYYRFGARPFKEKSENDCEGPYLCTNYYVYCVKEPCVMCSMALVHARARRVFFCFDNSENGGLKSKTKLHCVPALNHHFEVFTGFL